MVVEVVERWVSESQIPSKAVQKQKAEDAQLLNPGSSSSCYRNHTDKGEWIVQIKSKKIK